MNLFNPFLGAEVIWETSHQFVEGIVSGIDYKSNTVRLTKPGLGFVIVPIDRLQYKPTITNFLRLVDAWDYYGESSDSLEIQDTSHKQARALENMLRELPSHDRHLLFKLSTLYNNATDKQV